MDPSKGPSSGANADPHSTFCHLCVPHSQKRRPTVITVKITINWTAIGTWLYCNTPIGIIHSTWEVWTGRVLVDEITYPILDRAQT